MLITRVVIVTVTVYQPGAENIQGKLAVWRKITFGARNVAVEWLLLLIRILEVPCSDLDSKVSYPDRFSWFSSGPPRKCLANSLVSSSFIDYPLQIPGYNLGSYSSYPRPEVQFQWHISVVIFYFDIHFCLLDYKTKIKLSHYTLLKLLLIFDCPLVPGN